MNPNKALWEKGDFTRIAATMRDSGEAFVATLGIKTGLKVLDLGCGDGTTALPAANLARTFLAWISRVTLSRRGTAVRRSRASRTSGSRKAIRRRTGCFLGEDEMALY